jgi:hypothetical protein
MGCEKHYKSEIRSSDLDMEPTSWAGLTASKSTSANLSECDFVGRVPFALRCARRNNLLAWQEKRFVRSEERFDQTRCPPHCSFQAKE